MFPEFGETIIDLTPLLRGKDFAGITEGLHETLACGLCQRHLLGPESLHGGPIDGRLD
jgi:hypothetical protein